MNKIPVGRVVGDTWVLLFSEFETLIRFAWFPLVLSALIQVGISYLSPDRGALAPSLADIQSFDALIPIIADAATIIGLDLVGMVVNLVAVTVVSVAICRLILYDDRRRGRYVLLSFRMPEFLFACFAILIGVFGAMAAAAIAVVRELASDVVYGDWIVWASAAILAAIGLFLLVRLLPIYPIMVSERRMDFGMAFRLSRGNFWRLIGVLVSGMVIPLLMVGAVFAGVVIPFVLAPAMAVLSSGLGSLSTEGGPDVAGLVSTGFAALGYLIAAVAVTSLFVGLVSYAYKALRGLGPYQYLS